MKLYTLIIALMVTVVNVNAQTENGAKKSVEETQVQPISNDAFLIDDSTKADIETINNIDQSDIAAFSEYVSDDSEPKPIQTTQTKQTRQDQRNSDVAKKYQLQPSDIIIAYEISKILDVPFKQVVTKHKSEKAVSWGTTAKSMGIKPGSKKFYKLKNVTKKSTHHHAEKHKLKKKEKKKRT